MRIGWLRTHYVLVYAVLGCVLPYLPVYAEAIGLSDAQIGWVMGSYGLAVLIAPVIWTNVADRFGRTRTFIGVCYLLGMLTLALMTVGAGFAGLFVLHLAFALGFTALIPLLDGLSFHTLADESGEGTPMNPANGANGANDAHREPRCPADKSPHTADGRETNHASTGKRRGYWTLRVWGSVGWMLPGFGLALLVLAQVPRGQVATIALLTGGGFALLGLALSTQLPVMRGSAVQGETGPTPGGMRFAATRQAWGALRQPTVALFVAGAFLMFLSISIYYTFYPKWLGLVGVDAAWVGLITNLGVAVEIVFMASSGVLLRWLGVRGVMLLGAAAATCRLGLIVSVPTAWMAIATQIFHGPLVLAIYVMPPIWLNRQADPAYRHSMQGLYAALCFGIARIGGAAAGGYLSEWTADGEALRGLQYAFGLSALLSAMAFGIYLLWRDRTAGEA